MTIGEQCWELVCRTSGGHWWAGALLTCSLNNIQGLNTPTHVDNVQTEMHGQCTHWDGRGHENKQAINKSHMHENQEETWTQQHHRSRFPACEEKVFENWHNINVAADNDFSRCFSSPASSSPWLQVVQTLLPCPLAFSVVWLTDNNTINQKLWVWVSLWQTKLLSTRKLILTLTPT